MRIFIASFLSTKNTAFYDEWVSAMVARVGGALRPIPRGSAHLTHVFLGEVSHGVVDEVVNDVSSVVSTQGAVDIQLGPPGVVPRGRRPRLVAAAVTAGAPELRAIGLKLTTRLSRHLVSIEPKTSSAPHVTLARFGRAATRAGARQVAELLAIASPAVIGRADRVARIHVVRSDLTPGGPIYETLATAECGGERGDRAEG